MALSRLLLLCMVASEVWDVQTRPIDFVCNRDARRAMNIVAEMEAALRVCDGSTTLSTLVQLPCIQVHKASWGNKSVCDPQEQRGDIVASLKLLIEDVKVLKAASQPGCTSSLLHRLERSINNYLRILTHLELSGPAESPALSCVPQSTQSLSTILWTYNRLLSGKLEGLMDNLADKCTPQ
ncbi:thrombopoietin isoform X2 [Genypterus blacodes]|uniref:thrombopoietin isoform X2 n=1 Tax=Genypterus blacodes TaxID=154954 RepID=UPI003F774EE6